MNQPNYDELHANPAHWKLGIFYFCRQDQRVLVPKRIQGLGWTINFARPSALFWIAAVIGFAWGTVALTRSAGASDSVVMTVKLVLALGIILFCHRAGSHAHRRARSDDASRGGAEA
jgi:hypothetical protein